MYNYNPYYYQPNQNILPSQQIIQVNGKASVDTIQLAPNSSVLVMDTSAPIVWMCISDGIGKVTATPYDITVHQEKPPIDVMDIEKRLANIEETIDKLKGEINAKSNAPKFKQNNNKPERIPD